MTTNVFVQFDGGFNLCGVNENGSPTTTQIWDGGLAAAVKKMTEWAERKVSSEAPYVIFFVRPHDASKPTLQFTRGWMQFACDSIRNTSRITR